MKHILVPVNFSGYAANAARYALRLAAQHQAKITILHVYHIPVIDPMIPVDYLATLGDNMQKEASESVGKLIRDLKEYGNKHKLNPVEIEPLPVMGLAVDEIAAAVNKLHCDLIVLGRRHTEGMAKVLLGSVTSAVIQKAKVPVLVVPENTNADIPVTDILYASALDANDNKVLSELLRLARPVNAKLHCVHVNWSGDVENSMSAFAELARSYSSEKAEGKIVFEKVVSDNVEDTLLDYMENHQVDILVMLTHKRTFFGKLFDRSLTRKVAFKTNIPLLVFHDGE